jgi:hypothetical protein
LDTFVPYRAITFGCCTTEDQDKQRLIEEGERSLQEVKAADADLAPCMETNPVSKSCLCCPCNIIQRVCAKEVVTEEIYYVSPEHDTIGKVFDSIVPRSSWRVWLFRILGWLLCYVACLMVIGLFKDSDMIKSSTTLRVYGSFWLAVLSAIITTSCAAFVIALTYLSYSPHQSVKWACAVVIVITVPFIVDQIQVSMA